MTAFRTLSVLRLVRLPALARPRFSGRWLEYALQAAVVGWLCLWLMPGQAVACDQREPLRPSSHETH